MTKINPALQQVAANCNELLEEANKSLNKAINWRNGLIVTVIILLIGLVLLATLLGLKFSKGYWMKTSKCAVLCPSENDTGKPSESCGVGNPKDAVHLDDLTVTCQADINDLLPDVDDQSVNTASRTRTRNSSRNTTYRNNTLNTAARQNASATMVRPRSLRTFRR